MTVYKDEVWVTLSRQTPCNWTMSAANALVPIYNHIKKELINRRYIEFMKKSKSK